MIVSALVEIKRLAYVREHNAYHVAHIPMSIFWQVFQYFLIAAAKVFTNIGQIKFFYDQALDSMRNLLSALSLTTNALGNYLSTLLVTIVTKIATKNGKPGWVPDNLNYGYINYFFWFLVVFSLLNLIVYNFIARWYTYKKAVGGFQAGSKPS